MLQSFLRKRRGNFPLLVYSTYALFERSRFRVLMVGVELSGDTIVGCVCEIWLLP